MLDRGLDRLLDAAADRHRIAAGGDVAGAFLEDRRASTVAVVVPSPATSEVFAATSLTSLAPMFSKRVFELDFLADGDAVLGDGRAAERLVDDHVAAGRAHRDGDRVGQLLDALEHLGPGLVFEQQLLCHGDGSFE